MLTHERRPSGDAAVRVAGLTPSAGCNQKCDFAVVSSLTATAAFQVLRRSH